MRRTAVALLASLGLHATLLAGAIRLPAAFAPNLYLVPITLEEIKELPLRPPPKARKPFKARPVKQQDPGEVSAAPPKARDPAGAAKPAEAPAAAEVAETRRRGDVSAYGPEGSRVVAILRLDRLRAAPDARAYIAAVDDLLRLLPDRQRLLEKTDLDLYRDFDALLVATPNPLDDTVTFVAARHRLDEKALRAALGRGAKAGGRAIKWRKERGRYVGVRKSPGGGGAPERDERLLLLPAPGLVVIASPAYAKLLLDRTAAKDGGSAATDSAAGGRRDRDWSGLVARIDAEDGAIPEDAAFVLTATNLLRPGGGTVVASTSGKTDRALLAPGMPNQVSIMIGTVPTPFLEIRAEFDQENEAKSCEAQWPAWKQSLLGNPLVLIARVDPLLSGTQLQRDERTVVLRTTATSEEMLRVLRMIAGFTVSGDAGRVRDLSRSTGEH